MPAFPKLSESQLNALVAYLATPVHESKRSESSDIAPRSSTLPVSKDNRYVSGFGFMFTRMGLPVIAPPWTSLTAYDLNEGTIKWKIPLGEAPELSAKGFLHTGSVFPKVGPVLTAGGLLFTATRDRKVRALDRETGAVLWEAELDNALEGIPAVYEVNGREYLVVCAAAQGQVMRPLQGKVHGAYVAFALEP
ncbi:MAG: PQQ-binding-like beta-propeller repeat protein [Acidobacteriaceae bacterium]|nr:PQQ-binding-like beta-propeller repeat protein [Acidobacteriaceae bacterium]